MRSLVIVAASILLSTPALACEMGDSAKSAPDPSIASNPVQTAPVTTASAAPAKAAKAPDTAKAKKDAAVATTSAPKPAYFTTRASASN